MKRYFSAFSGMGGFDLPLRELGFSCVGWSESDKYAIKTFEVNFPELKELNFGDITKIETSEMSDFDLLVGGSPCQSFSIAGKRKGLNGISGLFFHYLRILRDKQPDNFIWENVRGVLSSNKGSDWINITNVFMEVGYNIRFKILNTKDYGLPQSRHRVFVVGQKKEITPFDFQFPSPEKLTVFLKDILEDGYTDRKTSYCIDTNYGRTSEKSLYFYLAKNRRQVVFSQPVRVGHFNKGGQAERVYSINGTSVCLTASTGEGGAKTGLYEVTPGTIRKLTPLECFRLQGFPDSFYHKAKEIGISDNQLYQQAGNAVSVPVVQRILESLYLDNVKKKQLDLF